MHLSVLQWVGPHVSESRVSTLKDLPIAKDVQALQRPPEGTCPCVGRVADSRRVSASVVGTEKLLTT